MSSNLLHTEGRWFKDAEGRVVILRGVNVAGNSKVPPFVPFTDVSLLDPLVKWGMNVIRLILIWEAVEPQPGTYNDEYVAAIETLVNGAGDRGIHVILDMHQDMFSRYLDNGCGDGCPSWAIDPAIPQDEPSNDERCLQWYLGVRDSNVLRAFESFFANVNGSRDHYIAMWAHVAKRFAANPWVIGYDLMNEPIGDDVSQIAPFYEDVGTAIREADPDGILFIESSILSAMGIASSQLPPLSLGNYAYAPHFYSASMVINDSFEKSEADRAFATFQSRLDDLGGVPLLLGEFGMPPQKTSVSDYISDIYGRLDECFYGGTQWNYTPGWNPVDFDGWNKEDFSIADDRGNLRANFKVRAYPQRIGGTPAKVEVDHHRVYMEWRSQPEVTAPTLLYVPVDHMFGGKQYEVVQDPSVACELDVENRRLTCTTSGEGTRWVEVRER